MALAFVLGSVLSARSVAAQTVMIQSAPAGAAIDLTFNGTSVATATADTHGDATLSTGTARPDTDVLIYVDSCAASVRVQLSGRGLQPAPTLPGCSRVDAGSIFIMRSITTFVIDITPSVAVHVAQGPPPPEWLLRGPGAVRKGTMLHGAPGKGLVLTIGAGGSSFGSIADKACGNVPECLNVHGGVAFSGSAEYWFARFSRGGDRLLPTRRRDRERQSDRVYLREPRADAHAHASRKGRGGHRSGARVRTGRRQPSRGHLHHDGKHRQQDDCGRQRHADDPGRHAVDSAGRRRAGAGWRAAASKPG